MVIEGNFYKNSYLIQRNLTQISYPIKEFFLKKDTQTWAHPRWRNNESAPPPGFGLQTEIIISICYQNLSAFIGLCFPLRPRSNHKDEKCQ